MLGNRFYKISFSIYRMDNFCLEIHTKRDGYCRSVIILTKIGMDSLSDRNIGLEIMENVLNMQVQHIKCNYIR